MSIAVKWQIYTGPKFVSTIVDYIIALAIVGMLFSIGILAGGFQSPIGCAFGDILLCTRNFIDILVFW